MESITKPIVNKLRGSASIIVFIVIILALPLLVKSPYIISTMTVIGIFGILALQLSLLWGVAGQVSMGQAAFYGIGAYATAVLSVKFGINPWLAMAAGAVLSGAIAALVSFPLLKLAGFILAAATIAVNSVVVILISQMKTLTGGFMGMGGIPRLAIGSFVLNKDVHYYYLAWIFTFLIIFFTTNILRSGTGRALRSIHPVAGGSEMAAQSLGVSPAKYKAQVFALSAIYCSLAGSIYAHWVTFISPSSFDVQASLKMLIMAVIGGVGSLWGAVLGAGVLVGIGEGIREYLPKLLPGTYGEFQVIGYGIILILVLMFLPKGLASIPAMLRGERVKRGKSWLVKLAQRPRKD